MIKINIFKNDYEYILNSNFANINELRGHTVFVTGATGLIGTTIVNSLLYANNIFVVALVRDINKAKSLFVESPCLKLIEGSIESLPVINDNIDYIIHCASPTQSKYFIEKPVETYNTIINGTINTLNLAKKNKVLKYIFLSSVEAYGTNIDNIELKEEMISNIDSKEVRNSYPIAKIASENICFCYKREYNINSLVIRLTQTFGPGVTLSDNRVFAQFAKAAIDNKDIILKTKGETKRSYIYTADAVVGILGLLTKGISGELYNLCNEDTYCSIYEMASLVAKDIANNNIQVVINEENTGEYLPKCIYNMSSKKINQLGFKPKYNLELMYKNMIDCMKSEKE